MSYSIFPLIPQSMYSLNSLSKACFCWGIILLENALYHLQPVFTSHSWTDPMLLFPVYFSELEAILPLLCPQQAHGSLTCSPLPVTWPLPTSPPGTSPGPQDGGNGSVCSSAARRGWGAGAVGNSRPPGAFPRAVYDYWKPHQGHLTGRREVVATASPGNACGG